MRKIILAVFLAAGLVLLVNSWLFSKDQPANLSEICKGTVPKEAKSFSAEEAKIKFIAMSFKALAKGFISSADFDIIKKKIILKIADMGEESFHSRYMDIYEHIYDSDYIVKKYKISKDLTRQGAIARVILIDKKGALELIDEFPDDLIYDEFHRFMFKAKEELPKAGDSRGVFDSLNRMIEYFKKKYL